VVEQGDHHSLLARRGIYARMHEEQLLMAAEEPK
jgi:ABC-type multidrug transport system fused ATPase/permease subunit